ncbi:hypothetical protein KC360_g240 [Hortaea werneckii]|nr:hypothetical protein KC325_g460 [Hortaea werneckii]KAI6999429.1 hypothetical protein KC359_g1771 [Hortaea werneckii]KAI7145895.1 hypothetical protein KC344_g4124 [Hortaea werneckii]KAI7180221.1 hypothetical protein KC360_g240 [Hortaea werneckii]
MQKQTSLARLPTSPTEEESSSREAQPRAQQHNASWRLTHTSSRQVRPHARKKTPVKSTTELLKLPLARTVSPIFGGLATKSFSHGPSDLPAYVADYTMNTILPRMLVHPTTSSSAWMEAYCQNPLSFHTFNFACAVHVDLARNQIVRTRSREVLFHKTVAISLLNRLLTNKSKDLEMILVSVLLLAGNELDERSVSGLAAADVPGMHFQPHMPLCRWISVYGRMEGEPAHGAAMGLLVQQLGGLSKITMPGLADIVAFAELMWASPRLMRPNFTCFWDMDPSILRHHRVQSSEPGMPAPGRGFFTRIPGGLPSQALNVMIRLATVDRYMADCRLRRLQPDEEESLIATRNAIQHALLSLPAWDSLTKEERAFGNKKAYECCVQTAALYSNAVIMAFPPNLGWHVNFVQNIRSIIGSAPVEEWDDDMLDLLIWSLSVGALANSRTPERRFFEDRLSTVLKLRRITSWPEVQSILEEFLWSDVACRHGAAVLWASIRE